MTVFLCHSRVRPGFLDHVQICSYSPHIGIVFHPQILSHLAYCRGILIKRTTWRRMVGQIAVVMPLLGTRNLGNCDDAKFGVSCSGECSESDIGPGDASCPLKYADWTRSDRRDGVRRSRSLLDSLLLDPVYLYNYINNSFGNSGPEAADARRAGGESLPSMASSVAPVSQSKP